MWNDNNHLGFINELVRLPSAKVLITGEAPFLAITASLVLKFALSVSKLVGSVRPHIFSTLKRNFSIFDFFDFWETPFSAISASLVLKFEISASKLIDSFRPHIFSTHERDFSILFCEFLDAKRYF